MNPKETHLPTTMNSLPLLQKIRNPYTHRDLESEETYKAHLSDFQKIYSNYFA